MHSKHLGKKLERIQGETTHQHWRTTPPQTMDGRRTTPPPPADEHHSPHTGLPPHSSSTDRTTSISSSRWRSPRLRSTVRWRTKRRRREEREKKEEWELVGRKWGNGISTHFPPQTTHKPLTSFNQALTSSQPHQTTPKSQKQNTRNIQHQHTTNNSNNNRERFSKIINSNYIMENQDITT